MKRLSKLHDQAIQSRVNFTQTHPDTLRIKMKLSLFLIFTLTAALYVLYTLGKDILFTRTAATYDT